MLRRSMTKKEVEEILNGKGDFVQIDYLTNFLKEDIPFDMKRFSYQKLAQIYEKKSMFGEAAKMFDNIALISIAFSEKIKNYVKEAELYIKAGHFDKVDAAIQKALEQGNASQKQDIYFTIRNFYKKQAEIYEKERKRNNAIRIYEKLFEMKISELEREEIKEKLIDLYERIGEFDKIKTI